MCQFFMPQLPNNQKPLFERRRMINPSSPQALQEDSRRGVCRRGLFIGVDRRINGKLVDEPSSLETGAQSPLALDADDFWRW